MGTTKPEYTIPSMDEIRNIPRNGFRVASTFSGCGGSCLGYRMAGYQIVWANEFVPVAQECYKANADEGCFLDPRDIKQVQPEEIFEQTGIKKGELDLFDGSPPCQAFSTAGKRAKGWGQEREYDHGIKQCNESLFAEYIRLLRGLQPKTFIAENVSGLVKGVAKGYFLDILRDLKESGYKVACRVLDAQWLGIPQKRQRTIFIGVRHDIGVDPVFPKPFPYRYSVRDALPWIVDMEYGKGYGEMKVIPSDAEPYMTIGAGGPSAGKGKATKVGARIITDAATTRNQQRISVEVQSGARPKQYTSAGDSSPAIMAGRTTEIRNGIIRRKFTIDEVKRICSFPGDFVLLGSYSQQWARLGNSVPPLMMRAIATTVRDGILMKIGHP